MGLGCLTLFLIPDLHLRVPFRDQGQSLLAQFLGQYLSLVDGAAPVPDHQEELVEIGSAAAQVGVDLLLAQPGLKDLPPGEADRAGEPGKIAAALSQADLAEIPGLLKVRLQLLRREGGGEQDLKSHGVSSFELF